MRRLCGRRSYRHSDKTGTTPKSEFFITCALKTLLPFVDGVHQSGYDYLIFSGQQEKGRFVSVLRRFTIYSSLHSFLGKVVSGKRSFRQKLFERLYTYVRNDAVLGTLAISMENVKAVKLILLLTLTPLSIGARIPRET